MIIIIIDVITDKLIISDLFLPESVVSSCIGSELYLKVFEPKYLYI